jgi:hypothetical protein
MTKGTGKRLGWRVINGNTLEILRLTEVEVIEKNLEYRWSYLNE